MVTLQWTYQLIRFIKILENGLSLVRIDLDQVAPQSDVYVLILHLRYFLTQYL